jgi:hypothetical protein
MDKIMAAVRPIERFHTILLAPQAQNMVETNAINGNNGKAKIGCINHTSFPTIAP